MPGFVNFKSMKQVIECGGVIAFYAIKSSPVRFRISHALVVPQLFGQSQRYVGIIAKGVVKCLRISTGQLAIESYFTRVVGLYCNQFF